MDPKSELIRVDVKSVEVKMCARRPPLPCFESLRHPLAPAPIPLGEIKTLSVSGSRIINRIVDNK